MRRKTRSPLFRREEPGQCIMTSVCVRACMCNVLLLYMCNTGSNS